MTSRALCFLQSASAFVSSGRSSCLPASTSVNSPTSGQAIVGHVEGGGVQPKSKGQPHAKPIAYAPRSEMPLQDAQRQTLSVAGDAQREMQDARRPVAGGPKGNQHAYKHGRFSGEAIARRRQFAALVAAMKRG